MTIAPIAAVTAVPNSLLATLGSPPGLLADIGGALTPIADNLQRQGWIVHMTSMDHEAIRSAARAGVRTALRAHPQQTLLTSRHYDGVVLSIPDFVEAGPAVAEAARIARPGATVLVSVMSCGTADRLTGVLSECGMSQVVLHTADGASLAHTAPAGTPLVAVAKCG
ncbi:hypothetical protein [Streptomyces sp. 5-10]|uniref:hypothetical protein n=1 Tax=Streptomyces sp. 5-10 TaxID=878925 RepID=UPI00168A64C6|nr:hypothetical protein [Streptomyces sp. 5-10]MBD3004825.1 hypothetical protein [Streptomyces sp. 5-10]